MQAQAFSKCELWKAMLLAGKSVGKCFDAERHDLSITPRVTCTLATASMRCPDTRRVESGGVGARALVMDLKAQKPTRTSSKLTVSPSSLDLSARPPRPQHFDMVCTRKKDYGDPPLPKQRKAIAVCDAAAGVGAFADTHTNSALAQNLHCSRNCPVSCAS